MSLPEINSSDSVPEAQVTGVTTQSECASQLPTPHPVATPAAPQVHLTFLIISGQRKTMSFDPETTISRLKERVWNTWPADWECDRPLTPCYLRVLHLGKVLQDDDTLASLKFPIYSSQTVPLVSPTIVHLSVRPYPLPSDDGKKPFGRTRAIDGRVSSIDGNVNGSSGCCGCAIC